MLDLLLIALLIVAAIRGYMTGLTKQVSAIVALILAFLLATPFSRYINTQLREMMEMADYLYSPLAFILAFIFIFVGCRIVAAIVDKFFQWAALNTVNSLLGSLLSVVKYALLISLLFNFVNLIDRRGRLIKAETKKESRLYTPIFKTAPALFPFVIREMERLKLNSLLEEQTDNS